MVHWISQPAMSLYSSFNLKLMHMLTQNMSNSGLYQPYILAVTTNSLAFTNSQVSWLAVLLAWTATKHILQGDLIYLKNVKTPPCREKYMMRFQIFFAFIEIAQISYSDLVPLVNNVIIFMSNGYVYLY